MRRVRYQVAMSLDGYIAGPHGETDWIVMDPDIDFGALFAQFDTLLMGQITYMATRAMGGPPMPAVRVIVVSRTLTAADAPEATVVSDPAAIVRELRAAPGKDVWLFGGGTLFRSLLAAGLVDTVEMAVIPVLLGGGIPLLPPGDGSRTTPLSLRRHQLYPKSGIVLLEYDVGSMR